MFLATRDPLVINGSYPGFFTSSNGDDFGKTSLIFPPIHSLQSLNPWMLNNDMEHHGRKTSWASDFLFLQLNHFTNLQTSESNFNHAKSSCVGYTGKCYFLSKKTQILDDFGPCSSMFHSNHCTLVWPICVPKQSGTIEWWKVTMISSNHRLFPTPTVSTTVDLKPRKPKNPKKPSLKGMTIPKRSKWSRIPLPKWSNLSEDSCWCHPQTAKNKLLAGCSKWFDISYKIYKMIIHLNNSHWLPIFPSKYPKRFVPTPFIPCFGSCQTL